MLMKHQERERLSHDRRDRQRQDIPALGGGQDGTGEGRAGVPAVGLCSRMRETSLLTAVNITQGVTEA